MSITPGNWSVGKVGGAVVSDTIPGDYRLGSTGHDDTEHYGGFLIAESMRSKDAEFLASCKELLLQAAMVVKDVNRDDLESVRNLKATISKFI